MNQGEWIQEVIKHRPEGFDPYVEKHFHTDNGLQYGNWNKYQGQKQIDERSVFPNEIIIDIDAETTEKCRKENKKVLTYLDNNGYDYILADTGGTGYHIHLFFQYKGIELEQYREYRIALYEYLKAECREKVDAETQLWDEQPVRFNTSNSKGHLVRALGGRKTSTENRKTQVNPTQLEKKNIEEHEEVEYPARIPWTLQISKTGTDKSDLSIKQIKDKVEEIKKEEQEMHKAEVETDYETKISGLEDVRDIPASKALEYIDIEYKKDANFECPFHDDGDPSANLHEKNGVERLYCFSNSCAQNGRVKVWNAVDILVEHGYTFKEALKNLSEEFGVDVQIGYNPNDYFGNNVKGNYVVQPERIVNEIMDQYKLKNVLGGGFYVWKEGYWQEINEDNDIIGTEVDKRLKNETAAKHRNNVREMIKNKDAIKVEEEEFQTPEKMIPFKIGVYNLEKDKLVEHKPEYNFDFQYKVDYNPDLDDNSVQRFIQTIMPDSEDKQDKLREVAVLSMAPWKINQKVPIFYGQGSNGKNQFVKIIKKIIGDASYHKTSARKLQQDKFEMASVVDKQMAFFDEFEDVSKPGQLKTLVGDENQNVREMRKESYTAKTSVYPIFAANELPNPKEDNDGFYRRWEIIDFKQKFTPEEDDGNPTRIPVKKLEEKYMNEEALSAFATTLINDLQRLMEENKLTAQQSTDETRRTWKKKGNALYAFIDKYLAPGDLPQEDGKGTDDWIVKDELLEVINNYMEVNNNSKVKKHQLTQALDNHPDFRIWKTYRPELEDGSRPRAYAGIKLRADNVPDVQRFLGFNAYASAPISTANELGEWLDIVDSPVVGKVLIYLSKTEKHEVPLFELVRNLDLEHSDIPPINNSDFVEIGSESVAGQSYPTYKIDYEGIEAADPKIDLENREIVRVTDYVKDQVESWSSDTRIDETDFIEDLKEEGFPEKRIEHEIDKLKSDGVLYEPEPGRLGKL